MARSLHGSACTTGNIPSLNQEAPMKPLILLAAFLLPCAAMAGSDCPKGSNVQLTDTTTSSQQPTADTQSSSSSGSVVTDRGGFKNHYPH